ncbi:MAG TPA: hypothetical protein PKX94_05910 [Opitutales bacterium]|nr:hypothetical protein [Opitutales bacterium]HOO92983.1 hypothetical protein [Opitutales bacterium]
MNIKILTAAATTLICSALFAQEETSLTLSTAFNSDYYFRGTQLADSFIETAVDYTYGDFYAGLWYASPFEAVDSDLGAYYANELDIFAGYGIAVNDLMSVDLGVTAYYYPELPSDDNPTWEPYVGVAFDTTLSPTAYVYYDVTLEIWAFEGGVSYSFPMEDESASFDVEAKAGYVSPDEGDGGFYFNLAANYVYSITDTASAKLGVAYTDGDSELSGGNWDNGFCFTGGLSIGF